MAPFLHKQRLASACLYFGPDRVMTDSLLPWKLLPILPICPLPLTSHFTGLYKPLEQPGATFWTGTRTAGRLETWTTTHTTSPPTVPRSLTASRPVSQADPPWSTWATLARTLRGTIWCGRCATHCTWTSAAWDSWLWSIPLRWEILFLKFEISWSVKKIFTCEL